MRRTTAKRRYQELTVRAVPQDPHIKPTPERLRQNGGVTLKAVPDPDNALNVKRVARAVCECWLDRYLQRGHIEEREWQAGMKFRAAWQTSAQHVHAYASAPTLKTDGGVALSFEDRLNTLTWADRVMKQGLAVLSPLQKLAVIAVCGNDEALGSKERVRTLQRGLEAMAQRWRKNLEAEVKMLLD